MKKASALGLQVTVADFALLKAYLLKPEEIIL